MKKVYLLVLMIFSLFLVSCWKNNDNNASNTNNDLSYLRENNISDKEIINTVKEEQKELKNTMKEEDIEKIEDNKETTNTENLKVLSDFDIERIQDPKECLHIKFKNRKDKIACVKKVEEKYLNSPNLNTDICKKLLLSSSKRECFDKVYFNLSKSKKEEKYCKLIKNDSVKIKCLSDIQYYKNKLLLQKKKEKKQQRNNKELENKIKTISDINSCDSLSKWKTECIINLVKKDKDLRYCDKLFWNDKIKCINDNWNELLKYNLLQAVKTKDSSYCKKIWKTEWVERCKSKIR